MIVVDQDLGVGGIGYDSYGAVRAAAALFSEKKGCFAAGQTTENDGLPYESRTTSSSMAGVGEFAGHIGSHAARGDDVVPAGALLGNQEILRFRRAEMARGGTGMCVSVSPGSARLTSFLTNSSEQILISSGVLRISFRGADVGAEWRTPRWIGRDSADR